MVRALGNTDLQRYMCDIAELPLVYQKLNKGIAFQKDSEFTRLFNHYIFKFLQEGQVSDVEISTT